MLFDQGAQTKPFVQLPLQQQPGVGAHSGLTHCAVRASEEPPGAAFHARVARLCPGRFTFQNEMWERGAPKAHAHNAAVDHREVEGDRCQPSHELRHRHVRCSMQLR